MKPFEDDEIPKMEWLNSESKMICQAHAAFNK